MVELGELERRHQDFANKKVRVFAISNDDLETSQKTQIDFPHLKIVSDAEQDMARRVQVIHPGASATGEDTNAPTTFLVNGSGHVCWMRRPERFITRLSPDEVLAAINEFGEKS